jgi:hypothetical protein
MNRIVSASLIVFLAAGTVFAQAPANDECSGAFPLTELLNGINPAPGASGNTYTITNATLSAGWNTPPTCTGVAASADVWFSFVPTTTGAYQIDTETPGGFAPGTLTDTLIEIYSDPLAACTVSAPIACDDDTGTGTLSFAVVSLTAGATYYVRVEDYGALSGGTFYVNVQFRPGVPPANDHCTGSMPALTVGSNPLSTLGATTTAGFTNPCLSLANDVWATFTPAATDCYRIDTENVGSPAGTMSDTVLAVYSSCASPPLACDNDGGTELLSRINILLTAGVTYLIQVGDTSTAPVYMGTLWLNISQTGCLPNDECAGSIPVVAGTNPAPAASGNVFSTLGASTSPAWASNCSGVVIVKDVWLDFTPGVSGVYQIDTETPTGYAPGSIADTVLEVYAGSCVPGGAIACDDDSGVTSGGLLSLVNVNLAGGTQYKIRVGAYLLATVNEGTFYLNVTLVGPPLTNNECTGAIALALGANPTPAASGNVFSNLGATTSLGYPAPCASLLNDVWFTFTPALSDTYVFDTNTPCGFTAGTMSNTTIALYDPTACGAPAAALACDADSGVGGLSMLQFALTAGTTYYLRVGPTANTFQTFYVNVRQGAVATNDECATSIPVGLGTNPGPGASCSFYSNELATSSAGWPAVCATIANDLWFYFTPATPGTYVIDTGTPCGFAPGTADNTTLAVYDSSCNTAVPPLACDADSGPGSLSLVAINLTGGSTYLIRVGTAATTGTFYLNINQGGPPPNESCATAIPIGLGTNPSPAASCNTFRNDLAIDTVGYPAVCGTIARDVWFVFTPPFSGDYRFDTETPAGYAAGTNTNTTVAVYGSCAVGPALACDADSGVTGTGLMSIVNVAGLVGGSPVYVRVGSTSASTTGTFYLTVSRIFTLTFSSPFGPGSIQFNLAGGPQGGSYFLPVSLVAGAFPSGWLFGVDIPIQELLNQLAIGYPFTGPLNAAGDTTFGPIAGVPSGLTIFSVGLGFPGGVIDFPIANTVPITYTVP